ncbi:DNA N-6-adenine-methyltransferase [Aeromonas sp. 31P]
MRPTPISGHGWKRPSSNRAAASAPSCWYRKTPAPNGYPGERASEVRHITGYHDENGKWRNGRVSFINKATGEEMKGNPKGSMLLIFAPNWRGECRIRDVSKLTLLLAGAEPVSAAA